jgi:hypothetical protein
MNNSLHRNFSRFKMDFNLKFGKAMSDLGFRKFNKIARGGVKT